jgi:hypothetical protein
MNQQAEAVETNEKETAGVEQVSMSDGTTVGFAGKRKILKDIIIKDGGVTVKFSFRNGEIRYFEVPASLALEFIGHGASQKIGDEAAGIERIDDIILAVDNIIDRLNKGEWEAQRAAGDGFAGASVVIRAIVEVTGKSVEQVKAFLQGKLDSAKAAGQKLTRAELYASFRNPTTKTGVVIERLERDTKSKQSAVNADDLLDELN